MKNTLFEKKDESFVCVNCGKTVPKLGYSSRNHCPFCLCSLHVDIEPGDRASECRGIMVPVGVTVNGKKGYVITHKCKKCGFVRNNKYQLDDDTDLLIKLSNPYNVSEK